MWGLTTLRRVNDEAARHAPVLVRSDAEVDDVKIPYVGERKCAALDAAHERVGTHFCDQTGLDSKGPALSQSALKQCLKEYLEQHGPLLVGVEEMGQFQCYVAVWAEGKKG